MIPHNPAALMEFFSIDHFGCGDFATFYEAANFSTAQKPHAICRLLDIKPDTLNRYLSGNSNPPKAMVRLLFHECHFGRSATDSHAHAGHMHALHLAQSLKSENERLKSLVLDLERENQELKQGRPENVDMAANSSRWFA